MPKGSRSTLPLPTLPATTADSLLKAQPRLFVLLGVVPPAAALAWWKFTGSPQGLALAGLILAGLVLFLLAHAGLKKLTAAHWGIAAGVAFIALTINGGQLGTPMLISFGSLLAVVWLALRLPARQRALAGVIAALVWLGTAGASTMVTTHDQAQASLAGLGFDLIGRLRDLLTGFGLG